MRWEKSVPSNLFRIVGIPVNRSSDKRGLTAFGIDSGIDLIVKTHKTVFLNRDSGSCCQGFRLNWLGWISKPQFYAVVLI